METHRFYCEGGTGFYVYNLDAYAQILCSFELSVPVCRLSAPTRTVNFRDVIAR